VFIARAKKMTDKMDVYVSVNSEQEGRKVKKKNSGCRCIQVVGGRR
jgi:hypothetical protein